MQMSRYAKSAIGLFFLFASVFPLVEKTLHEISHAEDDHCDSFSQVHLHQEEHHCDICDFVLDGFLDSVNRPLQEICAVITVTKTASLPFHTLERPDYFFRLKAPPLS